MVWLYVRHRVEDFARWKGLFEDIRPLLEDTGALKAMVLRDKDDEDVISVACSWEDAASAQRFLESEGLREALERAGLVGELQIHRLELLGEMDFSKTRAWAGLRAA
jgi:quinol monooxygenase YgiN